MEKITNFIDQTKENKIYVNPNSSALKNTTILFKGKNNILYVEDGVRIYNSTITFSGNNAVVYLGTNRHNYYININANNNTNVYFGRNNYISAKLPIIASEEKNIIIGNDCLFSFGLFFRTADPHLIYDITSKTRINLSKSILIGDHVWIGQNVLVFKGSVIGSGSVIGGGSVLSNKTIPSNVVAVGNPAKIVRENIFFSGDCTHEWTEEKTQKYMTNNSDRWIYGYSENAISVADIDSELNQRDTSAKRLDFFRTQLSAENKNRFFIPSI